MRCSTLALLIVVCLTSCSIYESEVPLGKPGSTEVKSEILGKWILNEEKKNEEVSGHIEIFSFNSNEYLVQVSEYADTTDHIESFLNFRMFPIQINKEIYYNIQILSNDEETQYSIYKLKPISGNRYKLLYLSKEQFEKLFTSSTDFRKYVEMNQKEFNKAFMTEGILKRRN